MNEYSEEYLRKKYEIGTCWETKYGPLWVIGYDGDMDGMGYLVKFKDYNSNKIINLHPYFIHNRIG